jgi:serine/threonine-protein kinase RsbW
VCSRIVHAAAGAEGQYNILFEAGEDELAITFTSAMKRASCIFEQDEDELGLAIINALMDQVELCPEKDNVILSMTKKLGVPGNGL